MVQRLVGLEAPVGVLEQELADEVLCVLTHLGPHRVLEVEPCPGVAEL